MKKIWAFAILLIAATFVQHSYAQQEVIGENETQSAVKWDFRIVMVEKGVYELQAAATIKPSFHLWALNAGGDGTLIPTSITVLRNNIDWVDEWKESKEPHVLTYEFVEGAVRFFSEDVVFSRRFKSKRPIKINGSLEFQTCNDNMCFPPESIDWEAVYTKP